ncbi:hypothetical protein [Enterovirga sp.]|uniref:hypothetical protein n=1 Tax=Enterovirga sp. TaxID=2026350 RepID=UPI00262E5382|nr:hypothetical protein [Enterovirga sp.]MDB5592396.1 hypothetical protein [Enterovirga sp.]
MPITSSSTSSSDPPGCGGANWRGFACGFLATAALLYVALVAGLVALDPYDTGRLALARKPGVVLPGPRTADASRGRDPAFEGAVIGNSHVQLLSPAELSAQTGIPFVSLAVPGTGPKEQLVLLDYFLRHRIRPARAVVLGIDHFWCTADATLAPWNAFPFWLYDRSSWRYVAGLARYQTFDDAIRRIHYLLGSSRARRVRPDGYWNYDEALQWRPEVHGVSVMKRVPAVQENATGRFPALDALRQALDGLPPGLHVVLVRPPVVATALPESGTEADEQDRQCRKALVQAADGRPAVRVLDWRRDEPATRVPEHFLDRTHMRSPLARLVERDIAAELAGLSAAPR